MASSVSLWSSTRRIRQPLELFLVMAKIHRGIPESSSPTKATLVPRRQLTPVICSSPLNRFACEKIFGARQ